MDESGATIQGFACLGGEVPLIIDCIENIADIDFDRNFLTCNQRIQSVEQ
jgi:hypothetical protein